MSALFRPQVASGPATPAFRAAEQPVIQRAPMQTEVQAAPKKEARRARPGVRSRTGGSGTIASSGVQTKTLLGE